MLQNPLTPPYGDSTATSHNIENVLRADTESVADSSVFNAMISTPTSNTSKHETPAMEDGEDSDDSIEEDQDMSDGGATLTMSHTYIQQQNTGLAQLQGGLDGLEEHIDEAGAEDLYGLESGSASPSSITPTTLHVESVSNAVPSNVNGPSMDIDQPPAILGHAVLPTTLSAVSLQLQHLQDGLVHMEAEMAADDQEGAFANIPSNPSFPLFLTSPFTSLAESSAFSSTGAASDMDTSAAGESQNLMNSQGVVHAPPPDSILWEETAFPYMGAEVETTAIPPQHPPPFLDIPDNVSDADQDDVEDHYNLSLGEFLYNWGRSAQLSDQHRKRRVPHLSSVIKQREIEILEPVRRSDLQGEICDVQRINWAELGVSRREAKEMRMRLYNNYRNVRPGHHITCLQSTGTVLCDDENYFRFRRMDFDHKVKLTHFQLRNVMACASRGHVFYAGRSRVWQWNPSALSGSKGPSVAMELKNPTIQPFHALPGGMQISTLDTAHDILVAGGFCGEYALLNLKAHKDTKQTEGLITDELNAITNHVQVHLHRGSSLPVASFSSNDTGFRVLDINTNTFIQDHKYDYAMNCSAISPDQRLRVCVGDTKDVMICNSDTGEILQRLDGHRDYGFACDWADDGWTVATGNQDMQVKIWDARKWTSSSGSSYPIATIESEMAGVRKLKFSPLGSGKRVLVAAEPADVVSIIDAQTFASKQTLNFFGEIGGVDFTNDGQDLFVANSDGMRGGIIQYERCGLADEGMHRLESRRLTRQDGRSRGYDWISDEDEMETHPKARRTAAHRQRKAAGLGVSIGHF